ncbi:complex I subunit 5 family protein [Roseibacillus persicicus]|uniref:complex I subunit 5 family protein n=1 Tax=Roseibacillus persicicus TaxID=454148 RepID=UPI00280F738C|nr:proton-conducting transporter membrane subunit [Roseibacillus persicicus]MDQ8189826.1 proton-conducting transporter membrane subunit [Roseibacillus persicicus]
MTPQLLILAALLTPFIGALVALCLPTRPKAAAWTAVIASALTLAASIALVPVVADGSVHAVHAGNWPAPFGIVLVADAFATIMLVVCQLVILASLIFCAHTLSGYYQRRHLYPLILTLSLGTNGALLTGDLFNLYVWFEVLLLSSFSIMAMIRGKDGRAAAWRYVVINLVSSLLFLTAAGLIYGKTGTLNFAELRLRFGEEESSFLIDSSAALLFGAFGIKAALIPLAFWLPRAYPQLPPAISALFAGLLTKIGLYAFYRVFGMVFSDGTSFPHQDLLFVVAILTMVGGVLGAVAQGDMRRILSFHIISQVGYMALALALFTPLALTAGIFYLAHHIIVKANLFLATSLVERHAGSSDLSKVSGVARSSPLIALLFAVPALSLAGLPPLSGFFAKFSLLQASLAGQEWIASAAIVAVGLLTVFSMLKIWRAVFWGESNESRPAPLLILALTSGVLALVAIAVGLCTGPILAFAEQAASSLLEPSAYLESVLQQSK